MRKLVALVNELREENKQLRCQLKELLKTYEVDGTLTPQQIAEFKGEI